MKIITFSEAVQAGLKKYFTGEPCKNGHISERYVTRRICFECQKDNNEKRRALEKTPFGKGRPRLGEIRPPSVNAIKQAEYRKRRLARDPEWKAKLAEQQRQWRLRNKERAREIEQGVYERAKARKEQ